MGPATRRTAVGSITAVGAMVFLAVPAQGGPRSDPIAYAACDVAPCTVPDNITAPGPGAAIESLPVPAAVMAVIVVKPFEPKPDPVDVRFFNNVQSVLVDKPTTLERIKTCINISINVLSYQGKEDSSPVAVKANTGLAVLFMSYCLAVVQSLQTPPPAAADAAAGCHQITVNTAVKVTRVGRGYRVQKSGLPKVVRGLPGVKLSCRRLKSGPGYQISIRPAKRGQKLAQAIGPTMAIGFNNPSTRSVPLHTAVAFR